MNETFTIKLEVSPNANAFGVIGFNEWTNNLKVRVKSPADKGKANVELEKRLSKALGASVKIISGKTSRKKTIKIEGEKLSVLEKLSALIE